MKRPALQNKRVGVLRMAFRARKVFGSFEKLTPGDFSIDLSVKTRTQILSFEKFLIFGAVYN